MFDKFKKRDFWNGLIMLALSALLYWLQSYIPLMEGVHPSLKAGLSSIVGYLIKNLILTTQATKEKVAEEILTESPNTKVLNNNNSQKLIIINKDDNITTTGSVE